MPHDEELSTDLVNNVWRAYLEQGAVPDFIQQPWYRHKRYRRLFHHLPKEPRCRICAAPFAGMGGAVMRRMFGIIPSKLNPQLCNECEYFAQRFRGGAEIQVTVLFADVRGSTQMAEHMNPTEFSALINRFYHTASRILFERNAMIEKLIGDAVTGFFTPGIAGPDYAHQAIQAAREIIQATGHKDPNGPWIPVGIGVHTGVAYVGTVDAGDHITDIAVLGDIANTGARLASLARAGEICASLATLQAARLETTAADLCSQIVKGRTEPVNYQILT